MILNFDDINLSKSYVNEFEYVINLYLPHNRKYYATLYLLYIPDINNNTNNQLQNKPYFDTKLLSVQNILDNSKYSYQGATYNVFDKNETGLSYIKILNYPIWFIDSSTATTQLNINDIHAGFIQEFNITTYRFPFNNCFEGVKTFVNSVIAFDESNRYFNIVSETKYSSFGKVFNTLYQCNVSLLKQTFNPNILKELCYNDKTHKINTISNYETYKILLNYLNKLYNKHKYISDYNFIEIGNEQEYFIDLLFLIEYYNTKFDYYSFILNKNVKEFYDFLKVNNIYNNLLNNQTNNSYNNLILLINHINFIKSKLNNCDNISNNDFILNNNVTIYKYKSILHDITFYSFIENLQNILGSNIIYNLGYYNLDYINLINPNIISEFKSLNYWINFISNTIILNS